MLPAWRPTDHTSRLVPCPSGSSNTKERLSKARCRCPEVRCRDLLELQAGWGYHPRLSILESKRWASTKIVTNRVNMSRNSEHDGDGLCPITLSHIVRSS